MKIQEWRGLWVSRYLSRPRSDSAPGAAARSSDKSLRPAREGAAGPGTERPGPRAPPGTEALRPPKPRSCPVHSGLRSSGSNPSHDRTGAGQGCPKKTLPAAAPCGSTVLLITSPQGPRPSRGIPRQLASLAPLGRPLHTQGPALSPGRFQPCGPTSFRIQGHCGCDLGPFWDSVFLFVKEV